MASSSSDTGLEFLRAAASGDMILLKILAEKLDNGGERSLSDIKDRGWSALHLAAATGNTHICKYLIKEMKFDIDLLDDDGQTPLYYAIGMNFLQTALYLLDNDASVGKDCEDVGCTALHLAAAYGNADFVKLFISRGEDIEAKADQGTPLLWAVTKGNRETVEVLLHNNANPDPVNSYSNPLIIANKVSLPCTDLLVKAGADPNLNFCGETPLHSAVVGGKVEIVVYLLNAGANPNVESNIGLTPLETAALYGNDEAMLFLFPVTTPIPSIRDWSISGIMKYINSEEAKEKVDLMCKQHFHNAKSKGEEAFKRKDYWVAINWYSHATAPSLPDAKVLSNKSLCFARLGRGKRALSEAQACVSLRPDWPKSHYREGVAWKLMKNYNEAAKSFSRALKLDPDNLEIQKALREAIEAEIADISI